MENSKEIWKDVIGFEGLYQVSSEGRIRSCDRYVSNGKGSTTLLRSRVLKQKMNRGYLQVLLSKECKRITLYVHRLVGMAFPEICGQFREEAEVDHINTVRTDNRAENLHWVTRKENHNNPLTIQNYSNSKKGENNPNYGLVGEKSPMFGKFGKEHPASKPTLQLGLQGNFIAEFESSSDAGRKLGICINNISECCRGQRKTAGGYQWRYKE